MNPIANRQLRVFVSSPFRDMQTERDELVLKIFPQLIQLCDSRSVTWGKVNARWGNNMFQFATYPRQPNWSVRDEILR